jgi:hypothetical protein
VVFRHHNLAHKSEISDFLLQKVFKWINNFSAKCDHDIKTNN